MTGAGMQGRYRIRVESYSGYKAGERPLWFIVGSRRIEVVEVEDRWYSPDASWFRVRGDDGAVYVLRRQEDAQEEIWTLESFRRA
jgi:hypothetical protein